jgi:hypothetical protein
LETISTVLGVYSKLHSKNDGNGRRRFHKNVSGRPSWAEMQRHDDPSWGVPVPPVYVTEDPARPRISAENNEKSLENLEFR